MSRRERIIVSIMLLTAIVGGYFYFFSSQEGGRLGQPGNSPEALDQFVIEIVNDLTATDRMAMDNFIIARAGTVWDKAIFRDRSPKTSEMSDEPQAVENVSTPESVFVPPPLNYSGYLKIGAERLAIINGEGYAVGEKILPEGAILVDVLPTKAVVRFSSINKEFILPLRELE